MLFDKHTFASFLIVETHHCASYIDCLFSEPRTKMQRSSAIRNPLLCVLILLLGSMTLGDAAAAAALRKKEPGADGEACLEVSIWQDQDDCDGEPSMSNKMLAASKQYEGCGK